MVNPRGVLLQVALVVLGVAVTSVMAYGGGNCSTPRTEPVLLKAPSGAMVLVHDGTRGTLSSAINGVIPAVAFNVTIEQLTIMERKRLWEGASDRCKVPRSNEDPWDPDYSFAPFVSNFTMADFDCHVHTYTYMRQGVEIRALKLEATYHVDPSFKTNVVYEFASEDLTIYPSQNTTYTGGILYKNQWIKDQLKITLDYVNFPWVEPATYANESSSFVSSHFKTSIFLPPGSGQLYSTSSNVGFRYNTKEEPKQQLFFEFESCWMVDGVPVCSLDYSGSYATNVTVPDNSLVYYELPMGVPLCSPALGQWNHAIYDPQLAVLFDNPAFDTPLSPQSAKERNITKIVAPVVVLGAIALVAIFIVVVFSTPSLKAKFMPSRVRTTTLVTTEASPNATTITAASPPSPANTTFTTPAHQGTSHSTAKARSLSRSAEKKSWKKSIKPPE